jgi:hypothetical protein
VGHQWYTGRKVKNGDRVTSKERDEFIAKLHRYRIRDVYIHAGPVRPDGTIDDIPGPFFAGLKKLTPGIRYLPWIGGLVHRLPFDSAAWRGKFIATLGALRTAGFEGVHLDMEPLRSFHPGYLDLLREINEAFEGDFFVSHATRRLTPSEFPLPVLVNHYWSSVFYRACMKQCDQTVLMGYDSCIRLRKLYRSYMQYQTGRLLDLAETVPGHRVMIGIPSYEDVPAFSDPEVENIANAVKGVRAALEMRRSGSEAFDGVAVYACWTTDSTEWRDYEVHWLGRY